MSYFIEEINGEDVPSDAVGSIVGPADQEYGLEAGGVVQVWLVELTNHSKFTAAEVLDEDGIKTATYWFKNLLPATEVAKWIETR